MIPSQLTVPVHISPRRLAHANLFVSDLEASLRFFNEVCGLQIVLRQPAINAGFVSNGNTHHDIGMIQTTTNQVVGEDGHRILAAGQGRQAGLNHLGWEMESEFALTKAYERALAAGWKIHRTVRHLASHSVYVFDPDGNIHEFYADVAKNWRAMYDSATRVSAQWTPDSARPTMDARYHDAPEFRRVDEAPLHPLRLTHAVLMARHFDRMCAFLKNGVGLLEVHMDDAAGVAVYSAPAASYAFCLALIRPEGEAPPPRKRLHHISFQLADGVAFSASCRDLPRKGVQIERTVDEPHKGSLFIRDPDGGLVEFYYRKDAPLDPARTASLVAAAYSL